VGKNSKLARPTTQSEIQDALVTFGLSDQAEILARLAQPSIRLTTRKVMLEDLPIGASRLGGLPDLPDTDWPENLSFIGQINLQDIRSFEGADALPSSGWLYFFYDVENQPWGFDPQDVGGWKVVYYDGPLFSLSRKPVSSKRNLAPFSACALTFSSEITMPDLDTPDMEKLGLSQEIEFRYIEFLDEYFSSGETTHRKLGYADQIQGEMQLECQLVSSGIYCGDVSGYKDPRRAELEPDAKDWLLLLQVDTDDTLNSMWGDVGRIYYWIRSQDLRNKEFSEAWLVLQCY